MIIKSRVNTFGFWVSTISTIGGLCVICFINNFDFPTSGKTVLLAMSLLIVILYGKILWNANKLIVDTELKTIKFKNRFTQISSSFLFDSFDGYFIYNEPSKTGQIKNLFLIKNKKIIKKISSFIYSNHSEIEKSLFPIKPLGVIEFSYWKSFKIFLRLQIIK